MKSFKSRWGNGIVWALASGPLIVVVAGIVTAWIAVRYGDKPITPVSVSSNAAKAPAVQGRNHSATSIKPAPN